MCKEGEDAAPNGDRVADGVRGRGGRLAAGNGESVLLDTSGCSLSGVD